MATAGSAKRKKHSGSYFRNQKKAREDEEVKMAANLSNFFQRRKSANNESSEAKDCDSEKIVVGTSNVDKEFNPPSVHPDKKVSSSDNKNECHTKDAVPEPYSALEGQDSSAVENEEPVQVEVPNAESLNRREREETNAPCSPPELPCSATLNCLPLETDQEARESNDSHSQILISTTDQRLHDIGSLVNKRMTDLERKKMIDKIWIPQAHFNFLRTGKRNLRFQMSWLDRWPWLCYSGDQDGAYCKPCVLFSFGEVGAGDQYLGQLVKTPFRKWKDACEAFRIHDNTNYHKKTVLQAVSLKNVIESTQISVELQIDRHKREEIQKNRGKVIPIIESVIFLARQGLAFRGHRDYGPMTSFEEPAQNDGNFRALLRFRVKSGDKELQEGLSSGPQNAKYYSPEVQNEIIDICNSIVLRKLVQKVNKAKCFTLLADETTDINGIEQMSLCARNFDEECLAVREDFLQFVPVFDVTGKGLSKKILSSFSEFGVDLEFLRGQGYDGAAAMSGQFNGVQAEIKKQHPNAIYMHCASHALNLAVSNGCDVPPIRNCLGTIGSIAVFFKYPKRLKVLEDSIEKFAPDSKKKRLRTLCPTRWVERHDSVIVYEELQLPVVDALEQISTWTDRETSAAAHQLKCAVLQTEFQVTLHVLSQVFSKSVTLSQKLQSEELDLVGTVQVVEILQEELQDLRSEAETEFKKIFEQVTATAGELGITIRRTRTNGRQTHRSNVPANTVEDYFRISVYLPFLDHFILDLNKRFLARKDVLKSFSCLLPADRRTQLSDSDEKAIDRLAKQYASDLDCPEKTVLGEVGLWYRLLAKMEKPPKSVVTALRACDKTLLPSVFKLLRILATLPVTTASCERSFSTLKRLKTYLRNSTAEKRLNGLAVMNIHRDIEVTIKEVIEEFAKRPRRLKFQL